MGKHLYKGTVLLSDKDCTQLEWLFVAESHTDATKRFGEMYARQKTKTWFSISRIYSVDHVGSIANFLDGDFAMM